MKQQYFIRVLLLLFLEIVCLHHYKKYLALASFGLAITALGFSLFAKTKKEEKNTVVGIFNWQPKLMPFFNNAFRFSIYSCKLVLKQ